jgi:hypothetical protein
MKISDLRQIAEEINTKHGLMVSVTKLNEAIEETKSLDPAVLAAHIRKTLQEKHQRLFGDMK